jgi:hypothetical protein
MEPTTTNELDPHDPDVARAKRAERILWILLVLWLVGAAAVAAYFYHGASTVNASSRLASKIDLTVKAQQAELAQLRRDLEASQQEIRKLSASAVADVLRRVEQLSATIAVLEKVQFADNHTRLVVSPTGDPSGDPDTPKWEKIKETPPPPDGRGMYRAHFLFGAETHFDKAPDVVTSVYGVTGTSPYQVAVQNPAKEGFDLVVYVVPKGGSFDLKQLFISWIAYTPRKAT